MTKVQIAAALQAIVRLQLDDCKRAIKDGTKTIALNELEDATRFSLDGVRESAGHAVTSIS